MIEAPDNSALALDYRLCAYHSLTIVRVEDLLFSGGLAHLNVSHPMKVHDGPHPDEQNAAIRPHNHLRFIIFLIGKKKYLTKGT